MWGWLEKVLLGVRVWANEPWEPEEDYIDYGDRPWFIKKESKKAIQRGGKYESKRQGFCNTRRRSVNRVLDRRLPVLKEF